jgi:hypothetical protein
MFSDLFWVNFGVDVIVRVQRITIWELFMVFIYVCVYIKFFFPCLTVSALKAFAEFFFFFLLFAIQGELASVKEQLAASQAQVEKSQLDLMGTFIFFIVYFVVSIARSVYLAQI